MTVATRRLVVMRHARAEATAPSDADRSLTAGGRRDATAAGRSLGRHHFQPDHALVSPAVRTLQTWETLAAVGEWAMAPDLEPALLHGGPETTLDLLRLVPPAARHVLVVGHNPTVSHLAQLLSDGRGDMGATRAMAQGHPPAAYALFDVDEEWSLLSWGDGHLVAFEVSRA